MNPIPVFLGVDVGKKRDRAAWAAVVPKRLGAADVPVWSVAVCEQAPVGTSYAALAVRTRDVARAFTERQWPVLTVMDATGIGAAVVERVREDPGGAEVLAVTSHAGNALTGQWPDLGVPKKALVDGLDEVLRRQGLTVAPAFPASDVLKAQLKTYVSKVSPSGHVRYEAARERDHDDVVSALQLALFGGARWWSVSRSRVPGRDGAQ